MSNLPPLPADIESLDETYPALAVADQVRAYARQYAAQAEAAIKALCIQKLVSEIEHAEMNNTRLAPDIQCPEGAPAVRAAYVQAIIDYLKLDAIDAARKAEA